MKISHCREAVTGMMISCWGDELRYEEKWEGGGGIIQHVYGRRTCERGGGGCRYAVSVDEYG